MKKPKIEIDSEKVKRKPKKTIVITLRITPEESKFLAKNKYRPTLIFKEAMESLRKQTKQKKQK